MKLVDPIDRAVAKVVRKDLVPRPQRVGARMLEEAMSREAGTVEPLVERVAQIIYSYDQDFIDRPWRKLGPIARQTYHEIAAAVIAEVKKP